MAAKGKGKVQLQEWMYDIVRKPVVTEKSMMGSEHGHVTFIVPLSATKPQVKQAVEALFSVQVKGVNTLIQKGKTKRTKGIKAFRSDTKKAIVTLVEGQTIDFGAGI
jgi:large subunit ribosomal protein L23